MADYSISDCLTFSLVFLFLLGALVAGPPLKQFSILHLRENLETKEIEEDEEDEEVEDRVGIIEDFTFPGKIVGGVDKGMIELYNSF
jgi:hypothetical protein